MRTPNSWVSKRDREGLDLSIKTSYVDRSRVQTLQVAIIWGITIHKPIYFRVPEGGSLGEALGFHPGSNDLPRLAAQWIKSATNVSILGILVGKQEKEMGGR